MPAQERTARGPNRSPARPMNTKRGGAGDRRAGPAKLALKLGKEHTEGEDAAKIDRLDNAASRHDSVAVEKAFITYRWSNLGQNLGFLGNLGERFEAEVRPA